MAFKDWLVEDEQDLQRKLQDAISAYNRLDGQRSQEVASVSTQIFTNIKMQLQQSYEEMNEMLGMAEAGEKELADVARMWRRLAETMVRAGVVNP